MRKVIEYILMILMGFQILLGSMYTVTNFGNRQLFSEGSLLPFPAGIVYFLQILLAVSSTWYFSGAVGLGTDRKMRGWITAFLLTVPFLLQMHMACPAWSVSLSALLWMTGLAVETGRNGFSGKRGILLGISYFCYGIFCRDGLWIGIFILLVVCILYRKSLTGKRAYLIMAGLMACIIFAGNIGFNRAWPEGRQEYIQNTPGAGLASRFVWPNFATNYFFWSEEVKEVMSLEEAIVYCQRVDTVESSFYPAMAKAYGRGKADRLCLEMSYRCLMDRTKETVTEIVKDFKDYLLIPFTIERNLKGEGTSLTAWNYGRMKMYTPELVKYYFRYALFELPVLLLGSILIWMLREGGRIGQSIKKKKKWNNRISTEGKLLLSIGGIHIVWYTMRSNLPVDYKQVLPLLFLWYLAAAGGLICGKPEKEHS